MQKCRLLALVTFGVGLLANANANANANTATNTRSLSIEEAVRLAVRHNLDLQIQRANPELARLRLSGAYGIYEPAFSFTVARRVDRYPELVDPKKDGPDYEYEADRDAYAAGLSGYLPTGLKYDLTGMAEQVDYESARPTGFIPPYYTTYTNEYLGTALISLRQPLLKDFWIDAPRQQIRLARRDLKISELALQQQIVNLIAKVRLSYHELTAAQAEVQLRRQALDLAVALSSEQRKRVEAGDVSPLDEKQSEAQVHRARGDLLSAEQRHATAVTTLKALLTDDLRQWIEVELVVSQSELPTVPPGVDRDASWYLALDHRPDLAQLRLEVEKHGLAVHYTKNQLFPQLDAFGSYGRRSGRESWDTMFSELGSARNPAFSYGVVLTVPLGNRAARMAHRSSVASRAQAELQVKRLEQDIFREIDTATRAVRSSYRKLIECQRARSYSEAALAAEDLKLRNGASTSFVVLQLQRDAAEARFEEVEAEHEYRIALVQLAFAEGSLLKQESIELKAE